MLSMKDIFSNNTLVGAFELNGQEHSIHKVLVTPGVAEAILDLNTRNRNWRREQTKKYRKDFVAGNWKNNGDMFSFAIDDDGYQFVANGQHRLISIAEIEDADFAIEALFFFGVREDALNTIDAGVSRTCKDHLILSGVNKTAADLVASAVITMMMTEGCRWTEPDSTRQRRLFTESEKLAFVKQNEEGSVSAIVSNRARALNFTVPTGGSGLVIPFSAYAAAFAYIWKSSPETAVDFFTAVSTGYFPDGSAPEQGSVPAVLRSTAIRIHGSKKPGEKNVQPGWWVRAVLFAWEAWVTGGTVREREIIARTVTDHNYEWVVPRDVVAALAAKEPMAA